MRGIIYSDQHHHAWSAFASPRPGGLTSRICEGLDAEDRILAALRADPSLQFVVCNGDYFDRKDTINTTLWNELIARRAETARHADTFMLRGNHDASAGGCRTSIEGFASLPRHRIIHETTTFDLHDGCTFHCVPHLDSAGATQEAFTALQPKAHNLNILFAHIQIAGATTASEFVLPANLTLKMIGADRFDLVILGHIHHAQSLGTNALYVGPLIQRTFSDQGAEPRYLILDTAMGTLTSVPIIGPTFRTIKVPKTAKITEEWVQSLQIDPERTTYLHLVARNEKHTRRLLEEALGDRVGGLIVSREEIDVPEKSVERLMKGTRTQWPDVIEGWVTRADTTLDRARLREHGLRLIEAASQVGNS